MIERDIRIAILPLDVLDDISADIAKFATENELSDYQKWILNERYVLEVPQVDFTPKSIVVAVWKQHIYEAVFYHKGKAASCFIEGGQNNRAIGGNAEVKRIFADMGFKLEYIHWMPQKRLAVRGGLCEYGRNNITYCSDWGSFVRIGSYISDIRPTDYVWRDVKNMAACEACGKCITSCPTKAIQPDRFLIDCDIWKPPYAHSSLYGCYHCQKVCPANKERLDDAEQIIFDEAETEIMINSNSFANFPENIRKKLWHFDIGAEFEYIPGNLKLMLEKEQTDEKN
ncbi:MAG: 4Fe-4S binding protein [Defluviitaleaceae bacterium]|nr:4Fe-4S binding protein [Defluviitaleaceae bacterium]